MALEAARRSPVFSDVAVYEPGVSIAGSIPADWVCASSKRLESGDARGAFTVMVRGAGFAPAPITRMPLWGANLILRAVVRGERWARTRALLASQFSEHVQLARVDDGSVERFASITARVLLLGGRKSPPFVTTELFSALHRTISNCDVEIIEGLTHDAPRGRGAERLATVLEHHIDAM